MAAAGTSPPVSTKHFACRAFARISGRAPVRFCCPFPARGLKISLKSCCFQSAGDLDAMQGSRAPARCMKQQAGLLSLPRELQQREQPHTAQPGADDLMPFLYDITSVVLYFTHLKKHSRYNSSNLILSALHKVCLKRELHLFAWAAAFVFFLSTDPSLT